MYLFFDTETTGLPKKWNVPVSYLDNWPRLVQLAYLYYDKNGNQISGGNFIIKPEGYIIPKEVSKIHGITTERANEEGLPLFEVLEEFNALVNESSFLVAHNIAFDEKIVEAEFLRKKMQNNISSKNKICTMQHTINFCAIRNAYGYKQPKLSELYFKLFSTNFEDAHNAAADITATARCFWELKKLGKI